MNENRIQQVLEIEKQAQEVYEKAVREAQQLPVEAEKEAQAILEREKAGAEQEARQLISQAQAEEETAKIIAEAEEKNRQLETVAMSNSDRAVNFIIARVSGTE
jgi:hypothetical protein